MFELKGSKSKFVRGEIEKIIIEKDNITIAFKEGYEEERTEKDKDGKDMIIKVFVPVGSDHIILKGSDYTSFLSDFDKAEDKFSPAEISVIAAKTPKVVPVGEPIEKPVESIKPIK